MFQALKINETGLSVYFSALVENKHCGQRKDIVLAGCFRYFFHLYLQQRYLISITDLFHFRKVHSADTARMGRKENNLQLLFQCFLQLGIRMNFLHIQMIPGSMTFPFPPQYFVVSAMIFSAVFRNNSYGVASLPWTIYKCFWFLP